MKKILGSLFILCFALSANAQLLWKISGNGLTQPSYVMGTHHLAALSIKDSIQGLQAALDNTKQVYGELKMSEMQSPTKVAEMMKVVSVSVVIYFQITIYRGRIRTNQ